MAGLAGLAMRRVVAAPLAVLAQLDAVRRVPLGLVRLVVAPLAGLARKRDRDSYISACHGPVESSAALRERSSAPAAATRRARPGRSARLRRRRRTGSPRSRAARPARR